jgi:hypothetical protein
VGITYPYGICRPDLFLTTTQDVPERVDPDIEAPATFWSCHVCTLPAQLSYTLQQLHMDLMRSYIQVNIFGLSVF